MSANGPRAARRVAAVALAAGLAACHHFNPRSYTAPEDLFAGSMREFRAGRYDKAQQGFQALTFNVGARDTLYPLARFYLAASYFGQGDYITASREYRRVADESPDFRLAPDALLGAADADAAQWTKPELDPTSGQTALATYQELQSRYPASGAAKIAAVRAHAVTERFAQKELENGQFYFSRNAYDSAILYFKDLVASYPSSSLVPLALVYIVRSYKAIGYSDEVNDFCRNLRQFYGGRADVKEYCGNGTAGR